LAFISTLGVLRQDNADIIKDAGDLLRHCHHGFLVVASIDVLFQVMEQSSLSIVTGETKIHPLRLAVVTGNLEQWKESIIKGTSKASTYDMRFFMDECYRHFQKQGLAKIWDRYRTVLNKDKTFYLELG